MGRDNSLSAKSLLIAIVASACALPAMAESVTVDNIGYASIDFKEKKAKLTSGSAASGTFYIPKTVDIPERYKDADGKWQTRNVTCKVVEISPNAFSGNAKINMIKGGENVHTIGSSAFENCINLTSVALPNGLEYIGSGAFQQSGLTGTLKIPASVAEMGELAFWSTGISELVFEVNNGVTNLEAIPERAFDHCKNLTDVKFANGIKRIGKKAFDWCEKLGGGTTLVEIPSSVELIDENAFRYCRSLSTITLNEGLKKIGKSAFYESGLKSVKFPKSLEYIEGDEKCAAYSGAFEGCTKLASVIFAEGLLSIGERAFYGCKFIPKVDLPYSLDAHIGVKAQAFQYCETLEYASEGPDQTLDIPKSAFEYCKATSGENKDKPGFRGVLKRVNNELDDVNKLQVQNSTQGKSMRKASAQGKGRIIGARAFYGCQDLECAPDNIESFDESAFYWCKAMTSFKWPESMTEVPAYAFDRSGLTSITLPHGVTRIKINAFRDCDKLASVSLPSGLKSIEDGAFKECDVLKRISLPASVLTIGSSAFLGCPLAEIEFPANLESIGSNAFSSSVFYPTQFTSVTIPDKVWYIGAQAFYDNRLTSLVLGTPDMLTNQLDEPLRIGAAAFYARRSTTLTDIKSYHIEPPVLEMDEAVTYSHFNEAIYETAVLTVPAGTAAAYREAEGWKLFKNIVEMGASGVTDPEVSAVEIAVGADGSVAVSGVADGVPVVVYGIDGSILFRGMGAVTVDSLPSGIYVVSAAGVSRKVRI